MAQASYTTDLVDICLMETGDTFFEFDGYVLGDGAVLEADWYIQGNSCASDENNNKTGTVFGLAGFDSCHVHDVELTAPFPMGGESIAKNCLFDGVNKVPTDFYGTFKVIDSYSDLELEAIPVFDWNDSTGNIILRNFTGGAAFRNVTNNVDIAIDLVSGEVELESTVTNGHIVVRGAGSLIDNSTGSAVVDSEGLISKTTMSAAVWDEPIGNHLIAGSTGQSIGVDQYDGYVHISSIRGTPGTTFPQGTHASPVDNLEDAVTLATLRGLTALHIEGDFTFDSTAFLQNFVIEGLGINKQIFTFEAGCMLAYCTIKNTECTGRQLL